MWKCYYSLLQIVRIVYSYEISDDDLKNLDKNVEIYLDEYRRVFKLPLKPKHHLLAHYSSVIKKVGPVKLIDGMRYESKHQQFEEFSKQTKNFKNLTKYLAIKHQQYMAEVVHSYTDSFHHGKTLKVIGAIVEKIQSMLQIDIKCKSVFEIVSLEYNGFQYRGDLLILLEDKFFRIEKVFIIDSQFHFLYTCVRTIYFDEFLNSYKVLHGNNSLQK